MDDQLLTDPIETESSLTPVDPAALDQLKQSAASNRGRIEGLARKVPPMQLGADLLLQLRMEALVDLILGPDPEQHPLRAAFEQACQDRLAAVLDDAERQAIHNTLLAGVNVGGVPQ